ncbi:hypothetical protein FNV43_RR18987 [Rhamnella rubrinervis]|uniref:Uncharacterized protein n=1 Tax=Rhamnella rubrinervis TaxID=2594499 RepID=A0A8K0E5N7_9ROSA|nr:hypothetical protein FNV43_RR18987 [Rhamnella rubrinervis]
MKWNKKTVKIFTLHNLYNNMAYAWMSINLMIMDTLVLDLENKNLIFGDLERFLKMTRRLGRIGREQRSNLELVNLLCLHGRHDALIVEPMATSMGEPLARPYSLGVTRRKDIPSSSGEGYHDISLDKDSAQRKGFRVPLVASVSLEEEDLEEYPREDSKEDP